MNRFIPDEIVEEIRSRCDIVDTVNHYVPLKKTGGRWKACCPFHQEKTPSFMVSPERQSYHCFGCGKGGDIFRFVMEHEGVDFPNAVHILAQRCNVVIPEPDYKSNSGSGPRIRSDERERLYQLHDKVQKWYQQYLWNNPNLPVSQYLAGRNIPEDIAKQFGLGAAPDSWNAFMNKAQQAGFTIDEMLLCGLVIRSEKNPNQVYDRFRNRLVFPIWNEQGRVVAFSARTIEAESQGAKYVNSPETPIFKKSKVLYALSLARQSIKEKDFAILCEGQLDVIAMHQAGLSNAVAPQGTAFTEEQARILKRYTSRLCLAFDSDGAGIKAAVKAIEICLPLGFQLAIAQFPTKSDPDDILKNQGAEALTGYINSAMDFFEFLLQSFIREYDVNSPGGKGQIVNQMLPFILKIDNSVTRSSYTSILARRVNITEDAVFNELNKERQRGHLQQQRPQPRLQEQQQQPIDDGGFSQLPMQIRDAEETLLELAVSHGTVGHRLQQELPSEMISRTPVGLALEQVIQDTMNDEWEYSVERLRNSLVEHPHPVISRIIASPNEYDHEHQEKAISDCVKTIKIFYIERELEKIMHQLQQVADNDTIPDLMIKSEALRKQIIQLRKK